HHAHSDDVLEQTVLDTAELRFDQRADVGCDFKVAPHDLGGDCCHSGLPVTSESRQKICLRSVDEGMFSSSRYLATVRRAILMPSSFRIFMIFESDSGFRGSSPSMKP